jgi:nicotinamidase-related amidase
VSNQCSVLERAIEIKIPIAVLEYYNYGFTLSQLRKTLRKEPQCAFFTKREDSGFSEKTFSLWLQRNRTKTLFLMGINANACVRFTARDALARGFKIVTSSGLIATIPGNYPNDYMPWYKQNGRVLETTAVT